MILLQKACCQKDYLISKNIPEEKIFATGIPISSRFLKQYNKEEILKEFDLQKDKKTIFKEETFNTLNSNKKTLFLSIIACVFASYMNQDNYLIYSLGFV